MLDYLAPHRGRISNYLHRAMPGSQGRLRGHPGFRRVGRVEKVFFYPQDVIVRLVALIPKPLVDLIPFP